MSIKGPSPNRDEDVMAYLDALDAQDLGALAGFWVRAETDAELERLLVELDRGVLEEEGFRPSWGEYRRAVIDAVREHLPSARAADDASAPLSVGEVATRMAVNDRLMLKLSAADRDANARLRSDATPLPAGLGFEEVRRLAGALGVPASERYWREFQQVAVLAMMSRGQASARAAARAAGKPLPPAKSRPASRRRGRPGKEQEGES